MARKKVFSVAELFYISQNASKESIEDVANVLGCSVESVKPYYESSQSAPQPEKDKEVKLTPETPVPDSYIYKQYQRNARYGAVVSTPSASEASDIFRDQNPVRINGKQVDCVHKPRGDRPIPGR